ncbi:MAG: hypothetical protein KDF65_09050, partial [Anaerolineae bacterium]|nr:hypothetical protein [Anaerolineae bacterium]
MTDYPLYVQHLLAQARDAGQWYCGQPDAAALCFEVLALFPDNREASQLVYDLFCDEWLIYDNRNALQQHIDEWDDRPWQQRRRLALSYRFMSRWPGWHREYEPGYEHERNGPADVVSLLEKGHEQLLDAYCMGDNEGANAAWLTFSTACTQTQQLEAALMWVGKQYAQHGFFADAAEVLTELCGQFDSADGRRLLAEVRWWRDHAHRIPWLPPVGDGARYKRMMAFVDPTVPADEEVIRAFRSASGKPDDWLQGPSLHPELAETIAEAMTGLNTDPDSSPVDWRFLDEDNGQPGDLPAWAKRLARDFTPDMAHDLTHRYRWSRPIPPPTIPPRHNPDDPPFEPDEFLEDDDSDW